MDMMQRFFNELQAKFVEKAENSWNPRTAAYHRSHNYLSPANFYNHRSRTFLKNKRKGL